MAVTFFQNGVSLNRDDRPTFLQFCHRSACKRFRNKLGSKFGDPPIEGRNIIFKRDYRDIYRDPPSSTRKQKKTRPVSGSGHGQVYSRGIFE